MLVGMYAGWGEDDEVRKEGVVQAWTHEGVEKAGRLTEQKKGDTVIP